MKTRIYIGCMIVLLALSGHPAWAQAAEDLEGALAKIVTSLSLQMKESKIAKVAVVPFPDLNGYQSTLGEFIAEELITQLFVQNPGIFAVVERRQLNKVLAEQKLSTSSVFEADNISKVGKILGVDAIVTGSIADLGAEVKINARAIAISTASVFAAAAAKSPKKGIAENLMMQNAPVPQGGAITAVSAVQRSDAYFSNSFLRVGVAQVARSSDSRQIMLTLSLENLTNSDLHVTLAREHSRCVTTMMDNLGNRYQPLGLGYDHGISGVTCPRGSELEDAQNYSTISAKGKTAVVIPYRRDGDAAEDIGSLFSFASTFIRLADKSYSQFSVGISNISITP